MEQLQVPNNELELQIGFSATPAIDFTKPGNTSPTSRLFSGSNPHDGFQISLEAKLQFTSLSRMLNGYLSGKRFEISEGLISKHVVVEQTDVRADTGGNLLIRVDFSGSFNGTVYLSGKPSYEMATHTIRVADLHYSLQSKSFLLNTARWLFDKKIVQELQQRTVFPLSPYYEKAKQTLGEMLNKEWAPGIRSEGSVGELELEGLQVLKEYILVRSRCKGRLLVRVVEINR